MMQAPAASTSIQTIPVFTVVPPHALLLDIAGPMEVLRYANQLQSAVRFDLRYIAAHRRQTTSIGLMLDGLEPLPDHLPPGCMVVVSGSVAAPVDSPVDEERKMLARWLAATVADDITLVTICSGALLAGAAGLLEGHACTTHADCLADLRRLAPTAQVLENRLYVEDRQRFSSAGISTGVDLMLHIVARRTTPQVALSAARKMVVYLRRQGNDPQISPWLSGRNHIHPAVHRVQDAIMEQPAADWSVGQLADLACLSQRHLSRLFREHSGMPLVDYINLIRVTLARDIISQSRLDLENVALRSGFASARHLRRIWSRHFDQPPSLHRASL